jgi:phosphoglycolate phosphatase-like HAD superfamily hydrolase
MHVCLFDIDGTLISSGGAGKAALEAALAELFGLREPLSIPLSGRTDTAILLDIFRGYQLPETAGNFQAMRDAYLRHLPACLARCTGSVLPGVAALLQSLRPRQDVAIGLLTGNIRAGALVKLGHFGLDDYFAFGGFGDDHHDRDDVARAALADSHRHLGREVPRERVWVVGDTPLDVRCARAIGARAVAVVTGWHRREELLACAPDLLLDDLSAPHSLLNCWVA